VSLFIGVRRQGIGERQVILIGVRSINRGALY